MSTVNLNSNTILNADCLNILPRIEENSTRLVIADPPYFRVLSIEINPQFSEVTRRRVMPMVVET